MRRLAAICTLALFGVSAPAQPLFAGPIYSVTQNYEIAFVGARRQSGDSGVPVEFAASVRRKTILAEASGFAGPGVMRQFLDLQDTDIFLAVSEGYFGSVTQSTRMSFDDVVFRSPGGTGGQTDVALRFLLEGSYLLTSNNDRLRAPGGSLSVEVDISRDPLAGSFRGETVGTFVPESDRGAQPKGGTGAFAGLSGDSLGGVFTTPEFTVPLDTPVSFGLVFNLTAHNGVRRSGERLTGRATADFGNSLTFPTLGGVFDLPDGFTVDSAQAGIADNRWLGAPSASPVPEPSSLALLGSGILGILGWGRRRRGSTRGQM